MTTTPEISIIPLPAIVEIRDNASFELPDSPSITGPAPVSELACEQLSKDTGRSWQVADAESPFPATVRLIPIEASRLGPEGYHLDVADDGITIRASTDAGFFYGVQTLRQLCSTDQNGAIPHLYIEDAPRFAWRGMHLDVSGTFSMGNSCVTTLTYWLNIRSTCSTGILRTTTAGALS